MAETFLSRLRDAFRRGRDVLTGAAPTQSPEAYFRRSDVWTPVESSNVKAVAYFIDVTYRGRGSRSGVLGVKFLAKNNTPETMYEYFGVPYSMYSDMLSAGSKGRYLDRFLKKPGFEYKKIG